MTDDEKLKAVELFQKELMTPIHLGDGVYVHFDGYYLWLTTQEGMKIALEPESLNRLKQFALDIIKRAEELQERVTGHDDSSH